MGLVGDRQSVIGVKVKPYEDPNNPNNSATHHTGKECIELGCENPAGTAWSPHWCWQCNAKRLERVSAGLEAAHQKLGAK